MDGLLLKESRDNDSGDWMECVGELRLELTQLRDEVAKLRRENLELRQQVGYWKGMHARAVERIAILEQDNEHLRGRCQGTTLTCWPSACNRHGLRRLGALSINLEGTAPAF